VNEYVEVMKLVEHLVAVAAWTATVLAVVVAVVVGDVAGHVELVVGVVV
jgi:prepilin signal peptidase PulO-like enzyme (type II secretory pathway)